MKKIRRMLLWMVTAALLLTACGGGEEKEKSGQDTNIAAVYMPKFSDIRYSNGDWEIEYVANAVFAGGDMYCYAEVSQDHTTFRDVILRIDGESGEAEEIFGTAGEDRNVASPEQIIHGFDLLCVGGDGTLWIRETIQTVQFDLPDDFDEEQENPWEYYRDEKTEVILHQLDGDGTLLASKHWPPAAEDDSNTYFGYYKQLVDGDGNLLILGDDLVVLDSELNEKFTLQQTPQGRISDMIVLRDGTALVLCYGESGTMDICPVDMENQKLGKPLPIADGVALQYGNIYSGNDTYLFLYQQDDTLYGYRSATAAMERLFAWTELDVMRDTLMGFSVESDGQVTALIREYRDDSVHIMSARRADPKENAARTELVVGCMNASQKLREQVVQFNRAQTDIHIQIREYAELNMGDSGDGGLTKLQTEIVAGSGPDILVTDGLPMSQYSARGIVEDLWPWIDGDPELGREKLMIRPLEAAENSGILPQIFSEFGVQTVVGPASLLGEDIHWSMDDMERALSQLKEGATAFEASTTADSMLYQLLFQGLDDFIDWTTGECSFDSPEFVDILKFCSRFPKEYNWEEHADDPETPALVREGKQLTVNGYFRDLKEFQLLRAMFDGDIVFVGFPVGEDRVGSSFIADNGIAMSATCRNKDAAWSFMRQLLLEQDGDRRYSGAFPVNKAGFDAYVAEMMKPEYELDENGDPVLDENGQPIEHSHGSWGWGDLEVDLYASTQRDLDQFMELYNAIDTLQEYNLAVVEIIQKEAEPLFAGDKTAETVAGQIQSRMKFFVNEQR